MMRATSNFGAGYKPSTYHALQTAKAKLVRALDVWRNEGKGVTGFVLSSDGWEDITGKPLIKNSHGNAKGVTLFGGSERIR